MPPSFFPITAVAKRAVGSMSGRDRLCSAQWCDLWDKKAFKVCFLFLYQLFPASPQRSGLAPTCSCAGQELLVCSQILAFPFCSILNSPTPKWMTKPSVLSSFCTAVSAGPEVSASFASLVVHSCSPVITRREICVSNQGLFWWTHQSSARRIKS